MSNEYEIWAKPVIDGKKYKQALEKEENDFYRLVVQAFESMNPEEKAKVISLQTTMIKAYDEWDFYEIGTWRIEPTPAKLEHLRILKNAYLEAKIEFEKATEMWPIFKQLFF